MRNTYLKCYSFIYLAFLVSITRLYAYERNHEEISDVYLCIGQSNMAGRALMNDSLRALSLDNVYLMNNNGEFEKATLPLNRYSTIRKDISMQHLGPAWSFAQSMAEYTGHKVGLIVNARGGSAIQEWEKGTLYYNEAVRRSMAVAKAGKLKAILWHQGESNCLGEYKISPQEYKQRFICMIRQLRHDLGCDSIPVIIGQLGRWEWADSKVVNDFNAMLVSVAEELPNCSCVLSEGLAPAYPGTSDPHFGTVAQLTMGMRYAKALIDLKGDVVSVWKSCIKMCTNYLLACRL